MPVIAFIEGDIVIRKILVHLGLWDTRNLVSPSLSTDTIHDFIMDESHPLLPQTDYYLM
ncbi:MAG: hypothetical protein MUP74_04125 [Desulfobacterales bacterium]|nr:hypothetical protein [Desulfobacterales bacterium]